MTRTTRLPSDRELAAATQRGDAAAWSELTRRHAGPVRRFATGSAIPDYRVEEAFARVKASLAHQEMNPAEPTLRATRLRLLHAVAGVDTGPAAADDPTLTTIATAFGQLPENWQAVLWHRCVDRAPAVEATVMLGRSTAGVLALEQTATRGLFEQAMLVELQGDPLVPPLCRPIVAALGAYRRGALPPNEARAVEEHLDGVDRTAESVGATSAVETTNPRSVGCSDCRARLDVAARLPELVAPAVVPWVTGRRPEDYRGAAGVASAAGVAALAGRRTAAGRRRAGALAVAAVLLAVIAAAVLIRAPFRTLEPGLGDLIDRVTDRPDVTASTSVPDAADDGPNLVELVFPETPRGAVYVPGGRPLDLSVALSSPAPIFAGGTGTIDLALTNNDTVDVAVTFYVRTSAGVGFDAHTEGNATCRAEDDGGATCALPIAAGSTASMSMRFTVEWDVPDRFVVDPGPGGDALDLPVAFLDDLLVGTVERGDASPEAGELATVCASPPGCIDRDPSAPRRLIVVLAPDARLDTTPTEFELPIAGSDVPTTPRRTGQLGTEAIEAEADSGERVSPVGATLEIDGRAVGGDDPLGLVASGGAPAVRSYDLDIASSSAAVQIAASSTASGPVLTGLTLVLDIVP